MKNNIFIILILMTLGFVSCEKMNDLHDEYLANGEIDYVGRVDSVKTYGGNNRIKFEYYITDPRATKLHVYWTQGEEMVKTLEIPAHDATDKLEFILGEGEVVNEKNHTFRLVTESNLGVKSVNFEALGNVYGDRYIGTLSNRKVSNTDFGDGTLSVKFGTQTTETEVGIKAFWFDADGESHSQWFGIDELGEAVSMENVDPEQAVTFQTAFLPEFGAIDTFYAETQTVEIVVSKNVALGAAVTASGQLKDSYGPANAVDGDKTSSASRWLNANEVGDHWLEVDLGQEYAVDMIKLFINEPHKAPDYRLEVEVNGEWQEVANVTGELEAEFTQTLNSLSTQKVRLAFATAEAGTYLRLFEIEVYTTIVY